MKSEVMRNVVIGFLGTTLDTGKTPERWGKWRPTVALCQQPDLEVARLVLLYQRQSSALLDTIISDIQQVSPETVVEPILLELQNPWDLVETYSALYELSRRYVFRTDQENYLVHITTGSHIMQICLFLLTEGRYLPARLLQTSPAVGGTKSPVGGHTIIDLELTKYDAIASRFRAAQVEARSFLKAGIATRNEAFNRLIEELEQVAIASKAPILLTGPTGAGKSQLARRIYELKRSRNLLQGQFVELNCATLRGDAAMSALFGHKKGAFTGATENRQGLLKAAEGGLLFLDEIGELGADEQAMLLRALEEKVFLPMGADKEERADFGLIAGTNRTLEQEVVAGRFREDLLARINLWSYRLPALAERREDIEPNLDFELERAAATLGRAVRFEPEARRKFLRFATADAARWRGNFRDLNAAVLRMATLAPEGNIGKADVERELSRLSAAWAAMERAQPTATDSESSLLDAVLGPETAQTLDPFDRVQLAEVVRTCRAERSLSAAGRVLFAESRKKKSSSNDADRLRKYLARFDLSFEDVAG